MEFPKYLKTFKVEYLIFWNFKELLGHKLQEQENSVFTIHKIRVSKVFWVPPLSDKGYFLLSKFCPDGVYSDDLL